MHGSDEWKSLLDDIRCGTRHLSLIHIFQQLLTPGTKISSVELDKFFQEKIQLYKSKLDEYFRVLADIESAVNGIDSDMFGGNPEHNPQENGADVIGLKTGINAIVSTVMEEFELFMDMAGRVAELHQKVREITGSKTTILSS